MMPCKGRRALRCPRNTGSEVGYRSPMAESLVRIQWAAKQGECCLP